MTNMLYFDEKMTEANKQDLKIRTSEKWNYCESISLQNLFSAHHCLPLLHKSKNIVMDIGKKKKIPYFQVRYMSNPGLNTNRALKEQVWEKSIYNFL